MKDINKKKFKDKSRKPFAKKSFGQNFLVDQNYINKIISALAPQNGETIFEIGAGRGALTEKLIESGANILAIELELNMIAVLKESFGDYQNFQLIEADVLKIDFHNLLENQPENQKVKLVANLPYYISTAILQKLIEHREIFSEMILMFQREVVDRITAEPGNSERGFLTVLVQSNLEVEKLFDVPPKAFRPAPKVWSSVVSLITKESDFQIKNENLFREIVSAGFRQKRKTIFNNLKNVSAELLEKFEKKGSLANILENLNIEPNRRAESLTLDEWKKLSNLLS